MKKDIIDKLKAKLDEYDLWDVAEWFYKEFRIEIMSDSMSEEQFPELPSDDCFRTLVAARDAMKEKNPSDYKKFFDSQIVETLLQIPYIRISETVASICEYTGFSEDTVFNWYKGFIDMFFVTKKTVDEFAEHISVLFEERICKAIFREAIMLGEYEAKRRIDGLIAHTGIYAREVLYNLYVKMPSKAYLFYPYYTDPVAAMAHLRKHFDEETTAHILVSDTLYLYLYKHEAYQDTPHYYHDHEYIANLIEKYEIQLKVAEKIRDIRKRITPDDANNLWIEEFIPAFESIKEMMLEFSYCPKIIRELTCAVTTFSACGVMIPAEFERYNAD